MLQFPDHSPSERAWDKDDCQLVFQIWNNNGFDYMNALSCVYDETNTYTGDSIQQ